MMKKSAFYSAFVFAALIATFPADGHSQQKTDTLSTISSVKLYRNQAEITRNASVRLQKGTNTVVVKGLPRLLYDWSVRGAVSDKRSARLLSIEVEQKALLTKRRAAITDIEDRLTALRDKDSALLDDLKAITAQEKFLQSVNDFNSTAIARELTGGTAPVKNWENTSSWSHKKYRDLLSKRRQTEKAREQIGKEIQKWEFELSQIAGDRYFSSYNLISQAAIQNKAAMSVQSFNSIVDKYALKSRLLESPDTPVDVEKQLVISIYSSADRETEITLSYIIPGTSWKMLYDIRAGIASRKLSVSVYSDIYQNTGEDWQNIRLHLSTGMPVNSIAAPSISPWYLDVYTPSRSSSLYMRSKKADMDEAMAAGAPPAVEEMEKEALPESVISEKGPNVEIQFPVEQTVESSSKSQKKLIAEYALGGKEGPDFYYELYPLFSDSAYLKTEALNSTTLPWLSGDAQIFLDNEFMGKAALPFTPIMSSEKLILGIENRIKGTQELVKKFEDSSGVFGGNRRINYSYKITIENKMPSAETVLVNSSVPVSRNEKIAVEITGMSLPFIKDTLTEKTTEYQQGVRKWRLNLKPGEKKEITYTIAVTFDNSLNVSGLR